MTFDDEFNALSASSSGASTTWMTQYPYGGENAYTLTPNDEQEYYSQATSGAGSPFSDTNGILNITATPATAGSNPYGLAYTSGLLTTYQSFSQTYGYFEVNAKLPAGQGLWPAFWMLPANNSCSSELDIFEMLGSDPSTIFGSTHGSWYNNGISQAFSVANTSTAFHTYGVDWEPDTITFYMDGTKLGSAPTPSTMNVPMYMLLNLAVGGSSSWGGAPSASTAFPATMSIDYVHAYATAATTFSTGSAAVNLPVSSTTAANLPTSGTTTAAGTTATGTPTVLGSGSDTLALMVNEDAYNGDAQFTVSVDGVQIGGTQTATASHSAGGTQEFDIKGTFAPGNHTASVNFLNDAYGGSSSTDRNLYVTGATVNGTSVASSSLSEYNGGTQSFTFRETNDTISTLAGQNYIADSNELFDSAFYLSQNPDVAAADVNPLDHFEVFGWHEGRNPNPLFDTRYYLTNNPDVAAARIDPLIHFEDFGWREGRNPDGLFDVKYYLSHNQDVATAQVDPLLHFEDFGWREERNPDALFDVNYYLLHNPDVAAAGVDPLVHYDEFGWKEGRNPSAAFDTDKYLNANPDVLAAGIDPLAHYLSAGESEGRAIYAVISN